jgi:hypothetical protein
MVRGEVQRMNQMALIRRHQKLICRSNIVHR